MNMDEKEFANILFAPSERDMYKARINKAIEYLNAIQNSDYVDIEIIIKELLYILKGSDIE